MELKEGSALFLPQLMEEQHSAAGARHAGTAFIPAPGSSAHAQGGLEALTLW